MKKSSANANAAEKKIIELCNSFLGLSGENLNELIGVLNEQKKVVGKDNKAFRQLYTEEKRIVTELNKKFSEYSVGFRDSIRLLKDEIVAVRKKVYGVSLKSQFGLGVAWAGVWIAEFIFNAMGKTGFLSAMAVLALLYAVTITVQWKVLLKKPLSSDYPA